MRKKKLRKISRETVPASKEGLADRLLRYKRELRGQNSLQTMKNPSALQLRGGIFQPYTLLPMRLDFGLLRNNHTGQIIAPAPIFDNGLSLMAFAGKDDLDSFSHFEAYAKMRTPPYQVSYEEICHAVMGPVQKAQLRRMIGFQFHRYPAGMVTEAHLNYLEKLLKDRVQELLNIPNRKHQKGSKEQNAR